MATPQLSCRGKGDTPSQHKRTSQVLTGRGAKAHATHGGLSHALASRKPSPAWRGQDVLRGGCVGLCPVGLAATGIPRRPLRRSCRAEYLVQVVEGGRQFCPLWETSALDATAAEQLRTTAPSRCSGARQVLTGPGAEIGLQKDGGQ